jgi:hypothetical protein
VTGDKHDAEDARGRFPSLASGENAGKLPTSALAKGGPPIGAGCEKAKTRQKGEDKLADQARHRHGNGHGNGNRQQRRQREWPRQRLLRRKRSSARRRPGSEELNPS